MLVASPLFNMRILNIIIIIIVILIAVKVFTPEVTYTPEGKMGNMNCYYADYKGEVICDKCGEPAILYKKSSRGKNICSMCFEGLK